jgi:hypothetical protein
MSFAAGSAAAAPLLAGCTAGPATLARMQAAAPSGTGATQTPADSAIEDGYSFVMLGATGTRLWPDKNAKLDSLMRAGERADAICKIKTADGASWLVLRPAGGILQYVPAVATTSVQAHEADLSRVHKIWAEGGGAAAAGAVR